MRVEASNIPPKDRAVEGILWYIQKHCLKGGDRLPPERELCELIGVSRTALRSAIALLISRDTLESRRGSGTYVCRPKPLNVFQEVYNYSSAVREAGLIPGAHVLASSTLRADDTLSRKANVSIDTPIFLLKRLRTVDGKPAAIETAYVNMESCGGIEKHDFAVESLYDVLGAEYGISVEHGVEHITITKLTADEAEILQAPEASPAYYEESLEKDRDGRTVEYVKAVILPHRYRFANNGEAPGVKTKVGAAWLKS